MYLKNLHFDTAMYTQLTKKTSQVEYKQKEIYRDIFKAIDEFTALRFTVTGASPAAKRTQILPITQHA
jgi:hypothetical protein